MNELRCHALNIMEANMIDDITKNVSIVTQILSNIGLIFLLMLVGHLIGNNAYFTPFAMYQMPFWFLGFGLGYCISQLIKHYRKN